MRRLGVTLVLLGATWVAPPAVMADGEDAEVQDAEVQDAETEEAPTEEAERPERREIPDLDGRPPSDENDALDAALWIPRILTSPLYLITEYVIRRPLGAAITELERIGAIDALFASGGDTGFIPTAFFEFGTSPSFGFYAFVDRFPFTENRISLHAATFGEDWLRLIVRDRIRLTSSMELALRFEARRRPDQLVEGIGFDATQVERARFGVDQLDYRVELKHRVFGRTAIEYQFGYRSVGFADRPWNDDPSVGQRGGPIPTGFTTGYELLYWRADMVLDTHRPRGELTRARLRARLLVEQNAAFGGLTAGVPEILLSSWIHWGGELAASTDFLGRGRVLMLRFRTELVSPLDDQQLIPFYELPDAGGKGPLGGFITGQLRGESTLGLTLEYVWPVYALLDGVMAVSVGNAFGIHYEGFEMERLRLAWSVGIVPRFGGEHIIEITAGFGTETFERGADVTQFRLVVGARHGL